MKSIYEKEMKAKYFEMVKNGLEHKPAIFDLPTQNEVHIINQYLSKMTRNEIETKRIYHISATLSYGVLELTSYSMRLGFKRRIALGNEKLYVRLGSKTLFDFDS